jgi:transposase
MKRKRPRRTYSVEFKQEAVRLARERGSIGKAAKELDLTESALREWARRAEDGELGQLPPLQESERQELQRLRKETKRLQAERDFLKNHQVRAGPPVAPETPSWLPCGARAE